MNAPRTARERARAELTQTIKEEARRQLRDGGAAALSLRAVARALGMASSAIYRYFPSRDDLLTALIVDAYDAIGETAEHAATRAEQAGADAGVRWLEVCRAARRWALAHPHEWALVYGSPVPGYQAPEDTVEPAARIGRVLAAAMRDAAATGILIPPDPPDTFGQLVVDDVRALGGDAVREDPRIVERSIVLWIAMVGAINFELFGHLHNVVTDPDAYFDAAMIVAGRGAGLFIVG